MVIVYYSLTGKVETFVSRIDKYTVVHIDDYKDSMGEYVLITSTVGQGEVHKKVNSFLEIHHKNMVGVCASARQVWRLFGTYGKSAEIIHNKYHVPILLIFEMTGSDEDRQRLYERIEQIEQEKLC